ncbi:DNA repair helicase XPB [Deinococcus peraridilitoris]|uniref:DNA 3'-5' helicase n=1 Tax=Deinococcus peraridilitoris (strain DSM 19664 / LMG 22246 / CIP 109416 / KR-200) TaxID=937777 RepID=L0A486_DEIPD|nr:DNA repair helicase XPB [Deinococcus peraridilitoris]AFZ68244.1 DNA/RNA helicase, superfamily II [Deinococcus peraridilitoris DSM 19664]
MSGFDPLNPLIVQADRSIYLEVHNERAEAARAAIAPFAELEKSPEHLHTYRITPLSLWNAASAGITPEMMVGALETYAKFPVPPNVATDVRELAARWGRLQLIEAGNALALQAAEGDAALLLEVTRHRKVVPLLGIRLGERAVEVPLAHRGLLKQALLEVGWPVEDLAGYSDGLEFPIGLSQALAVRDYQEEAARAFYQSGSRQGGSGVVVLPPGAGKTVVGMVAMSLVGQRTLVLTTNRTSVNQWRRELLDKTSLSPDDVAEYGPGKHRLAPVTLATYQMLTARSKNSAEYPHMELFRAQDWGLIVYDEVHLLPAPIFRLTAEVQARRRLGLTATLIREDGREGDVFSLIGPKRYDLPWKDLEGRGWIATAECCEVRVRLPEHERLAYALAEEREKFRLAAENPRKRDLTRAILALHAGQPTLVIGQYLGQLELIAQDLEAPLITGQTPQRERERMFDAFREGRLSTLVLSKVGNFALDLPEAQVMVQVSGTFGSRQEEAQRLGRLLRPKRHGESAQFYSLVTRETREEDFAHHRQLFLAEQGYAYHVSDEAEWDASSTGAAARELN